MKSSKKSAGSLPEALTARVAPQIVLSSAAAPIYVEISPLLGKALTGIGRFAARLVEALAHLVPLRLFNTIQGDHAKEMNLSRALPCGYEIALDDRHIAPADEDLDGWVYRLFERPLRLHDSSLAARAPALYTMLRPNERHFRRELCLIHDFTPLIMPWAHVQGTRKHFGRLFGKSITLCDKLVANSQSTKSDAAWLCDVPADDVVVGYPGPTLCVHKHAHPGSFERQKNVILVVSTLEPRKNGKFLFDWFRETSVLQSGTELWWVGPNGWMFDISPRMLSRDSRGRKIKLMGMVPDRQLCAMYRQAAFSVYPSLYEGFGFPVLDSLRHGTPVLTSFNSSLQEFAGQGVFYFDPCDPQTLDDACAELMQAWPCTIDRADLEGRFSWESLALKVVALCA
jgi:glycosyltransferase involved in cell wall biosynthesis